MKTLLLLSLLACSSEVCWQPICPTQHPSRSTLALEVPITQQATLFKCQGELLGLLEPHSPMVFDPASETAHRGGNRWVRVANVIEVWSVKESCQ